MDNVEYIDYGWRPYRLSLIQEWATDWMGYTYRRVQLPDREQVPCSAKDYQPWRDRCLNWTDRGWANVTRGNGEPVSERVYVFYCDECFPRIGEDLSNEEKAEFHAKHREG